MIAHCLYHLVLRDINYISDIYNHTSGVVGNRECYTARTEDML